MNYWDYRNLVKDIIPRKNILTDLIKSNSIVKEKGRKVNYKQFDLKTGEMNRLERLLNLEEINSFIEVSLRAAYCPMPLNADVWDGLKCPFRCRYCFADAFRSSLYTSFFDNGKTMGLRSCKPDFFKRELDKMFELRGKIEEKGNEVQRAFRVGTPIRLGIRFEDFTKRELRDKISLEFLRYLKQNEYPIMINTKSNILSYDEYLEALSENPAKSAVHMTMLSNDEDLNKKLEPGAPPFSERIKACKELSDKGVRVVARIEPFMVFVNDEKEWVDSYVDEIISAGIKYITFDTYSYSSCQPGIREGIERQGIDFERMYLLMSESQWMGSLLLGKFMEYLQGKGLKCSTFDFGNIILNDEDICCNLDGYFKGGYNYGNLLTAAVYIKRHKNQIISFSDFENYVQKKGIWFSESLRKMVFLGWNLKGNEGYNFQWIPGFEACGVDEDGSICWKYNPNIKDFRQDNFTNLLVERKIL